MGRDTPQFVLGVDLDGVVANFIQGLKPIAAEWVGKEPSSLADEVSYGFQEWGLTNKGYELLHRFAVKERRLFEILEPIEGAPSTLRRLSQIQGLRVRIITHRLYIPWFHREAIEQTIAWLEKHGILYWDLCFMKDKAQVGADLYIEDSPHNITSLRKAVGKGQVIVFGNSTNRDLPPPRVESWKEIESLVRKKVVKWKQSKNSK